MHIQRVYNACAILGAAWYFSGEEVTDNKQVLKAVGDMECCELHNGILNQLGK